MTERRRIPIRVPNELLNGVTYGLKALERNRLARVTSEIGGGDEKTTEVVLIPEAETDEQAATWLGRLLNRTPRPANELKVDIDDHVNAMAALDPHLRAAHEHDVLDRPRSLLFTSLPLSLADEN